MSESVDRRSFISSLGFTAALGAGACVAAPRTAGAVVTPRPIDRTGKSLNVLKFGWGDVSRVAPTFSEVGVGTHRKTSRATK